METMEHLPAVQDFTGQLSTPDGVREYMLAGRAKITIRSKVTGVRFTYKVTKKKDGDAKEPIWFVNLLRGADNENDFTYMGIIKKEDQKPHYFTLTKASKVTAAATSVKAFQYLVNNIFEIGVAALLMPKDLEVWHEGTCGRCGRSLTVPESVERGIGPECIKKM